MRPEDRASVLPQRKPMMPELQRVSARSASLASFSSRMPIEPPVDRRAAAGHSRSGRRPRSRSRRDRRPSSSARRDGGRASRPGAAACRHRARARGPRCPAKAGRAALTASAVPCCSACTKTASFGIERPRRGARPPPSRGRPRAQVRPMPAAAEPPSAHGRASARRRACAAPWASRTSSGCPCRRQGRWREPKFASCLCRSTAWVRLKIEQEAVPQAGVLREGTLGC